GRRVGLLDFRMLPCREEILPHTPHCGSSCEPSGLFKSNGCFVQASCRTKMREPWHRSTSVLTTDSTSFKRSFNGERSLLCRRDFNRSHPRLRRRSRASSRSIDCRLLEGNWKAERLRCAK